jgi:2-oxoglutarate ferredoxin oxidoreductase subunit alpha
MARRLCSGNRIVAEGALAAGCRFFAGYPITPASEIYEVMMRELPGRGGLGLAAPDEISSLCYCVGASLRGLKAMTATSGPGWALMIETLQYALMTETPVVIALVQRLGPSTGGATQGAQGDVWLAEFATSGGYTIPVFSPSTAAECHDLTVHAFNWAERLRTPVVLLSDKEVGMTTEVVDEEKLATPAVVERQVFEGDGPFATYGFAELEHVPAFAPVGEETKVTVTGSAHDQQGRLRKNAPEVLDVLRHLERKIQAHAEEMALVSPDLEPGAGSLVVSYGITSRAARQAVSALRREGVRVSSLQVQTLFPAPRRALAEALDGVRNVFVVEGNLSGQYRAVLAPQLAGREVVGVNKIGSLVTPGEIAGAVRAAEA